MNKKIANLAAVLAMTMSIFSCASMPSTLVGQWNLQKQDKTSSTVVIQDFGSGKFYLHGNTPMDGVYQKQDDKLVCVKPDDPRLHPFVWRIQDDHTLTLIEQPDVSVSQERLLGTLLTRPLSSQ